MWHLTDIEKKCVIIGGSTCTIFGLFILVTTAVAMPSINASKVCADIDCLKERFKLICEKEPKPNYLDCENIMRCTRVGEQEIMKECIKAYPADNDSRACNSQDLLLRSWCDYTRGAIPK
jgi:hypothetical protein